MDAAQRLKVCICVYQYVHPTKAVNGELRQNRHDSDDQ